MRALLALVLAALATTASAQMQQAVFPDDSGDDLIGKLVQSYRSSPRGYSPARDEMYGDIDRVTVDGQEGVIGIYTGYFVPLDGMTGSGATASNPRADVFNQPNENTVGVNAEHTYPQSQGAGDEPARSDLHHLFPSKVNVNAARGSLPFGEVPDVQTAHWYRDAEDRTTTPDAATIDGYSELGAGRFEPRESVKGDVARAVFYFYTMYGPLGTGAASTSFFNTQRETLYDWHYADPIDSTEYDRTLEIADYQGQPNPYVLDSTLARRAFFPEIIVTDGEDGPAGLALRLGGPNPFRAETRLTLSLPRPAAVEAEVADVLGRRVATLYDGPAPAGPLTLRLDGAVLAPGPYVVRVVADGVALTRVLARVR